MKAVRVHEFGGPEVLHIDDIDRPEPGPDDVLIKIEASGLNFIDNYHRSGQYQGPLPFTLGVEGAGVVETVGANVKDFKPGDRAAYVNQRGSHAEYAVVPAHKLVPVPDGISTQDAAAVLLQGLTAHYLTHSTYPLQVGNTALIHAAAGGTGLLLVQIAKRLGARVIGTVSTEEKAALAREAGADEMILYTKVDFEEVTKHLTNNTGVHVVYESVGKTTFDKSLNCLRPRGYLVLFGQSSGPVAPIDPQILNAKGALFLTRPTLAYYVADRKELLERTRDIFGWMAMGQLKVRIDKAFPLAEVVAAQKHLLSRDSKGKILLIP